MQMIIVEDGRRNASHEGGLLRMQTIVGGPSQSSIFQSAPDHLHGGLGTFSGHDQAIVLFAVVRIESYLTSIAARIEAGDAKVRLEQGPGDQSVDHRLKTIEEGRVRPGPYSTRLKSQTIAGPGYVWPIVRNRIEAGRWAEGRQNLPYQSANPGRFRPRALRPLLV